MSICPSFSTSQDKSVSSLVVHNSANLRCNTTIKTATIGKLNLTGGVAGDVLTNVGNNETLWIAPGALSSTSTTKRAGIIRNSDNNVNYAPVPFEPIVNTAAFMFDGISPMSDMSTGTAPRSAYHDEDWTLTYDNGGTEARLTYVGLGNSLGTVEFDCSGSFSSQQDVANAGLVGNKVVIVGISKNGLLPDGSVEMPMFRVDSSAFIQEQVSVHLKAYIQELQPGDYFKVQGLARVSGTPPLFLRLGYMSFRAYSVA